MLKNKKICNFASPIPGCIGSVQQTPQQRIRVNPLLLVNTFGYSQSPSSGDSGAGSRRRPRCLPAACWQPSGLRWPEARGRTQHSFLPAQLRLPSPPGMAGRVPLLRPPPCPPTPPRSRRAPSSQPLLPSSTQLLTCLVHLVLRSDLVEFLSPLLLSHRLICPFAYCMCLLDADKRKIPKNSQQR